MLCVVEDPRYAEGGTMASIERETIIGIQGQSPWWGEVPLKLKAFCPFSYKRGAKS